MIPEAVKEDVPVFSVCFFRYASSKNAIAAFAHVFLCRTQRKSSRRVVRLCHNGADRHVRLLQDPAISSRAGSVPVTAHLLVAQMAGEGFGGWNAPDCDIQSAFGEDC